MFCNPIRYVLVALCVAGAAQAQDIIDPESGDTAGPDRPEGERADAGPFSDGYFRFGAGSTNGDDMVSFKLNGAGSKYRLGNESDLYGEASLGYRAPLRSGSNFVTEVMVNGSGNSNALFRGASLDGQSDIVQAYAGIENIGDGAGAQAFLWAGRRYYRRRDVHITDYYYDDFSGDGIGLEAWRVGAGELSTALFYYDDSNYQGDQPEFRSTTLDVRFSGVPLGNSWVGELGLAYLAGDDGDSSEDGYSVRVNLENLELGWGESRSALMYGQGIGLDFNSKGAPGLDWSDNRWRFVTQALILTSEKLETQATAVWQRTETGGEAETWVSAGLRPQYNITDDWGVALEVGYDYVDADTDGNRSLTKVTLAPFYSFGKTGFFARPQLRAFATWASWSEVGAISDQAALGNDTSAVTLGLQLEQWW